MKRIFPDILPQFSCLGGSCPDTCCKDWQIILDDETLARYRALEGALGEAIRRSLVTENGQTHFRLENGHCPLLTHDGLCRIQLELGEAALCTSCRCHPRFTEIYGQNYEISLSLSCPAAARLILQRETPLTLVTETDDAPVTQLHSLDAELYLALMSVRTQLFSILQQRQLSLNERLGLMLLLCARVQKLLDEKRRNCIPALLKRFSAPQWPPRHLSLLRRLLARAETAQPCRKLLCRTEHLTQEFAALLAADTPQDAPALREIQQENLMFYFLFRQILKAVNDGKLLVRMQSCVFHLLCLRELSRGAADDEAVCRIAALYSRELEHSEENGALLRRALTRGTLRTDTLIRMLAGTCDSSQHSR